MAANGAACSAVLFGDLKKCSLHLWFKNGVK
jgi:hypothetical protein